MISEYKMTWCAFLCTKLKQYKIRNIKNWKNKKSQRQHQIKVYLFSVYNIKTCTRIQKITSNAITAPFILEDAFEADRYGNFAEAVVHQYCWQASFNDLFLYSYQHSDKIPSVTNSSKIWPGTIIQHEKKKVLIVQDILL